jgi:class 3 adenylate cyclase
MPHQGKNTGREKKVMISIKTDLKKVYYFSTVFLTLLIVLVYFFFFMSVENFIIQKYLPASRTDAVSVVKSDFLMDYRNIDLALFGISIVLFALPVIYSLVTYGLYIKRPSLELRAGFRSVKEGDFETRITERGFKEMVMLYEDFNNMVKECQKQIAIRHYVSGSTQKMVEHLNTGEITTQPRRKLVTILFSDVRDFTTFSEENDPLVVISTINEVFDIQVAAIKRNSGDIDKFIGDEIMVEFPSPSCAFKAAQEIQAKMQSYNRKRSTPLEVGIGINYGEAIVGAIGAGEQFDWTTIGHTVNVARRLCGAAEPGHIVISQAVYEKLKIKRECKETEIRVKGVSKAVKTYIFSGE